MCKEERIDQMVDGFYLALDVRCEGTYVPAVPSKFCPEMGCCLPGEPAHIEDFRVFLGNLEITNEITKAQLSELETDYLIYHEGYEEGA